MRSAESVEEMDERNTRFEGCSIRNKRKVHGFLNGIRGEHSPSAVTDTHHIAVIAENGKSMRCDGASGNMKYGRG